MSTKRLILKGVIRCIGLLILLVDFVVFTSPTTGYIGPIDGLTSIVVMVVTAWIGGGLLLAPHRLMRGKEG